MGDSFHVKIVQPAYEFIRGLPPKMRAKVYRAIDLLKLYGYRLGEPHAKTLRNADGIRELRVKLGTDICRIFYFHHECRFYVCASGYTKKSDKTSAREIERALRIRNEYVREHNR
jgi:phage-related protein